MTEQQPLKVNTSIGLQESGGPAGMDMERDIGSMIENGKAKPILFNLYRCCGLCDDAPCWDDACPWLLCHYPLYGGQKIFECAGICCGVIISGGQSAPDFPKEPTRGS